MEGYRGEVVLDHPVFPKDSQATCGEASIPVNISAPDIVCVWPSFEISLHRTFVFLARYSKEDDIAIDAFHRGNGK
jgi:hypothetical protein